MEVDISYFMLTVRFLILLYSVKRVNAFEAEIEAKCLSTIVLARCLKAAEYHSYQEMVMHFKLCAGAARSEEEGNQRMSIRANLLQSSS